MNKKIKRIAPLQLGKMLAVLYAIFSAITIPFIILGMISSPRRTGLINMGLMILMPLIYIVIGFVGGIIVAAVYNLCAKWVGGIEITLED